MTTLTVPVQHLKSATPGAQPSAGQILEGQIAVNTADRKLYSKDNGGAVFQAAPSFAEHTSGLALKANLNSPTFTGTPAAPTPGAGDDSTRIATTAFVNTAVAAAQAGLDVKQSVRVVVLTNVNLASPGGTLDGISMASGNRVLLAGQSTAAQNGIYVWNGASSAMTRATDADASAEVTSGLYTFVEDGTYANSGWVLTTLNPITVGSTALAFQQFSGAGQITAGANITKTGNTLAVSDSPAFTGNPTAPTQAADNNSTRLATTAYVLGQASSASPLMDGTAAAGTSTRFSRQDHVHPTDTSRAPVNSPTFTGVPAAPTATAGTNTTQIATTAFVTAGLATKQNTVTAISGGDF